MMRITLVQGDGEVARLRIEGRVTAPTAADLDAACTRARGDHRTLVLDLAGVTFVDAAGAGLLRRQREQGAVVMRGSGFVAALVGADRPAPEGRPDEDGDGAWLERLRGGDEAAFDALAQRHTGRMLATARRMLRNEDDAREVVQEAFLSAFRALPRFAGTAKVSTWLHRITVNAALMRMRRRRARPETPIDDLLPRFDTDGHWLNGVGGWDSASDVLLERSETRAMVRRCIDRLPETYRTVLILRDIEELDTDEAASRLGVTPNAVKIRLHRARQALRALIERDLAGAEDRPAAGTAEMGNACS